MDEVRDARAKDAQDLLVNAKERLAILHTEVCLLTGLVLQADSIVKLSETFRSESPADVPVYQRALEDLVATNTLLKHDVSELGHMLVDSRDEVRALRDEIDELRVVVGVTGRVSFNSSAQHHQASELSQSHSRTESSPIVGTSVERAGWARMSVVIPSRTGGLSQWEHYRRTSMAASLASISTADGLTSPGLGMGPVGEFGGALVKDENVTLSLTPMEGVESPQSMFRASPSGGIAYVLNGVPKSKVMPRAPMRRSFSLDRPKQGMRTVSVCVYPC